MQGIEPWHLWGSEQSGRIDLTGVSINSDTQQLAKARYLRPDTWTFFFVLDLQTVENPGASCEVTARFDVTLGVGRTSSTIKDFAILEIQRAFPLTASLPAQIFAGVSGGVLDNNGTITRTPSGVLDFPAQDIQCQARITGAGTAGSVITYTAAAYFAPRSHVRPEWFNQHFQGELGGR